MKTRGSGEFARCLDVAAVGQGHTTVFDSYPKNVERKRRKRWARTQLTELRQNCARFHGTALEPYVTHLIAISEQLPTKVEKHCEEFMKAVRAMRLDGALEHAGRNFALIYAGGCIAIEAKILPWTEARSVSGHRFMLPGSRGGYSRPYQLAGPCSRDPEEEAQVGRDRGGPAWADGHARAMRRLLARGGRHSVLYHSRQGFRRWFASRAQAVAVLRWLYDQGDLIAEKGQAHAVAEDYPMGRARLPLAGRQGRQVDKAARSVPIARCKEDGRPIWWGRGRPSPEDRLDAASHAVGHQ